jgi:hypothetical protein
MRRSLLQDPKSIDERRLGKDQSIFRPTFEVSDHAILSGEEGSKHLSSLFLRAVGLTRLGKLRWWQELGIEI